MVKRVKVDLDDHYKCNNICLVSSDWEATPWWWTATADYCDRDQKFITELWFDMLDAIEEIDDLCFEYVTREVDNYSNILMEESVSVEAPDQIWFEYYENQAFNDTFRKKEECYLLGKVLFHIISVLNLKWIHIFRKEAWEKDRHHIPDGVTFDEFKHDTPEGLTLWEEQHDLDTPDKRVKFYQSEMNKLGL